MDSTDVSEQTSQSAVEEAESNGATSEDAASASAPAELKVEHQKVLSALG